MRPVRLRLHVDTLQTQYLALNPISFLQELHFRQKVSNSSHPFWDFDPDQRQREYERIVRKVRHRKPGGLTGGIRFT